MLPSPGFSIPSIGTPLQQLEEDQQIIANNPYYAHPMMNTTTTGLTPAGMGNLNNSNNGVGSSGLTKESTPPSLPSLMTPSKLTSYQPSYTTPQSMMQPQTPVSFIKQQQKR